MYRPFLLLSLFFLSVLLKAQCPPTGDPIVIVNEVGNFGVNAEYVEILVVGYPGNPYAKVDMRDWILNDNNYTAIDHGNEPGHLRFGDCFDAVAPGTLIVIYNEKEPAAVVTGANALAYPGNSACLQGFEGFPNHSASNHAMTHPVSPNWLDLVPLRNLGDGIQILDANESPRHAVFWGDCSFGGAVRMPMQGLSAQGQAFLYMGGMNGWQSASNYVSSATGSPGAPNSSANAVFIESLLNGNGAQLSLSCKEKKAASGPYNADGEGQITITGGQSMVTVTVVNPQNPSFYRSYSIQQAGEIILDNLLPGTYRVKAVEVGGCETNCEFQVSFKNTVIKELCAGQCTNIGDPPEEGFCYSWTPKDEFQDPYEAIQEVCPTENITYIRTVVNASGDIVKRTEYQINVVNIHASIERTPEVLCPGGSVLLEASGGFDSYVWTNQSGAILGTAQAIRVFATGTYTVQATLGPCVKHAFIVVTGDTIPSLSITPPGPTALCQPSITLQASEGFEFYNWYSDGQKVGSQRVALFWGTGEYTVVATTFAGCTATASTTVFPAIPDFEITPNPARMCERGTVTLAAPPGFASYAWSDVNQNILGTSNTFTADRDVVFTVTVTNSQGCVATASRSVEKTPAASAVLNATVFEICQGQPGKSNQAVTETSACSTSTSTLSVAPGPFTTYSWSTGSTSSTITVDKIGVYKVTVVDAQGCSSTLETEIKPCFNGQAHLALTDGSIRYICPPNNQSTINAGSGFSTYAWSTGASTPSITVVQGGVYTVTVSDGACSAISTVNVIQLMESVTPDLEVYKPKVIDPAEPMIPEADEDAPGKGAMTFVNLDNDDRDVLWDNDDKEVTGGDDELMRLKLKMPKPNTGLPVKIAVLTITGGTTGDVKFWKSKDKLAGEYQAGTKINLDKEEGNFWTSELWLEALNAHTTQQAISLELRCDNGADCSGADVVKVTNLGIQSIVWEGLGNGASGGAYNSNVLDAADPNFHGPAGLSSRRVFPDRHYSGTGPLNDKVNVAVALSVAPVYPVTVYLRTFDVDDPSSDDGPVDPNDRKKSLTGNYAGTGPGSIVPVLGYDEHNDNRGIPGGGICCKFGLLESADSQGIASISFSVAGGGSPIRKNFQVSLHPGDNYRLVANGDLDFIQELLNRDVDHGMEIADGKVRKNNGSVQLPNHYCSDVLTVWRLMHLEYDAMRRDIGNENKMSCFFTKFKGSTLSSVTEVTHCTCLNGFYTPNVAEVGAPHLISPHRDNPVIPPIPDLPVWNGQYENGVFEIPGMAERFDVEANGTNRVLFKGTANLTGMPVVIKKAMLTDLLGTLTNCSNTAAGVSCTLNLTCPAGGCNLPNYVNGNIKIANGRDSVIIREVSNANTILLDELHIPFLIQDDDDTALLPYNLANDPDHIVSVIADARNPFLDTYVVCINDLSNGMANFVKSAYQPNELFDIRQNNQDSRASESPNYWVGYVCAGFESKGTYRNDADPDNEAFIPKADGTLNGITGATTGGNAIGTIPSGVKATSNSVVWYGGECSIFPLENIREIRNCSNRTINLLGNKTGEMTIHEIGHQFGLDHIDDTFISQSANDFKWKIDPSHVNFIRSRKSSPGQ